LRMLETLCDGRIMVGVWVDARTDQGR
jgi:hypothetical protein